MTKESTTAGEGRATEGTVTSPAEPMAVSAEATAVPLARNGSDPDDRSSGSSSPFPSLAIDFSGDTGGGATATMPIAIDMAPATATGGPPADVHGNGRTESKVIIIGSGPAGLTAAIYAARANLEPIVLAGSAPGGQLMITSDVENYPGFPDGVQGPDLMAAFRAQAERFGTRIVEVAVDRVDFRGRPFRIWARGVE